MNVYFFLLNNTRFLKIKFWSSIEIFTIDNKRNLLPTFHQWHQHILQPISISKPTQPVPKPSPSTVPTAIFDSAISSSKSATTATTATTAATTAIHPAIQLPGLSEQSNFPAGFPNNKISRGHCHLWAAVLFGPTATDAVVITPVPASAAIPVKSLQLWLSVT